MKNLISVLIALLIFSPLAFAAERGWVSIDSLEVVSIGNGQYKTVGGYTCGYAPIGFSLEASGSERIDLGMTQTPGALNDQYQQVCMERINGELPGAIANKNDIRVKGGWTK